MKLNPFSHLTVDTLSPSCRDGDVNGLNLNVDIISCYGNMESLRIIFLLRIKYFVKIVFGLSGSSQIFIFIPSVNVTKCSKGAPLVSCMLTLSWYAIRLYLSDLVQIALQNPDQCT